MVITTGYPMDTYATASSATASVTIPVTMKCVKSHSMTTPDTYPPNNQVEKRAKICYFPFTNCADVGAYFTLHVYLPFFVDCSFLWTHTRHFRHQELWLHHPSPWNASNRRPWRSSQQPGMNVRNNPKGYGNTRQQCHSHPSRYVGLYSLWCHIMTINIQMVVPRGH